MSALQGQNPVSVYAQHNRQHDSASTSKWPTSARLRCWRWNIGTEVCRLIGSAGSESDDT